MNLDKKVNTDLIGGLIGLGLTALFWLPGGHGAALARVREFGLPGLGTRFPTAIMLLMVIFSVMLLVKGFVRADRFAPFADERLGRILVVGLLLLGWVLGMQYLGFVVTSAVVFTLTTLYLARMSGADMSWRNIGGWSIIIASEIIVLYLIFTRVLLVPLPRGIFI